ncbi:Transport and Golgi organization protein 2 -like protein [Halotydeus destructor]|nr:Transport and Golgi organization protein 2 -like protein [Halotydeus destructor]
MCMLFIYSNPNAEQDEYPLIVTNIRDEYFMRPTRTCQFWNSNPNIIGGMDLEEGRVGGTWFAMNKSGKIGALLNMLQPIDEIVPGKRHRGFLVTNYLESQSSGPNYLDGLIHNGKQFADFLMVTIDVKNSNHSNSLMSFYTNMGQQDMPVVLGHSGFYTFSNNVPHKPWIKTIVGRKLFENIVVRNRTVKRKRNLIRELFGMMSDQTEFFPDEQLMIDGRGYYDEYLRGLSAINVKIPEAGFGSRTQSVVLVDKKGNVDFIERTFEENVLTCATDDYRWPMKRFRFRVDRNRDSVPLYSMSRL